MTDAQDLTKQKTKLFHDVFDNVIPERVPINVSLHTNVIAGYAGVHGGEALWNPDLLTDAALELGERIPTDVSIFGGSILNPSPYQALGANSMKISTAGLMQHPNHVGLLPEDYDAFIENAYDCVIERVLPRNYTGLDFREDPARALFTLAQGIYAKDRIMAKSRGVSAKVRAVYGGYAPEPGTRTGVYAPLDILTDSLRSLSGMSMDIRRMPDKVEAAVESLYAWNYLAGIPPKINGRSFTFFPLHLATYMKVHDFERLWWPTFIRQSVDYAALGHRTNCFCEHDWSHLLDYLLELPAGSLIQFEKGDPQTIKDKLGKRHIITGAFPLGILRTCTKQECIDKTKEFLDIMMPGGNFIFQFDKNALTIGDIDLDNLAAVCETVYEYGRYSNAGEKAGVGFNKDDYTSSDVPPLESKYYRTWEQYLELNPLTPESAKAEVMEIENMTMKFVYSLCQ